MSGLLAVVVMSVIKNILTGCIFVVFLISAYLYPSLATATNVDSTGFAIKLCL